MSEHKVRKDKEQNRLSAIVEVLTKVVGLATQIIGLIAGILAILHRMS